MIGSRYPYAGSRNLASRSEWKYATPMTETFKYDHLDCHDTVLFNNEVSVWLMNFVYIMVKTRQFYKTQSI